MKAMAVVAIMAAVYCSTKQTLTIGDFVYVVLV